MNNRTPSIQDVLQQFMDPFLADPGELAQLLTTVPDGDWPAFDARVQSMVVEGQAAIAPIAGPLVPGGAVLPLGQALTVLEMKARALAAERARRRVAP